jgi:hypothetical protein
MCGQVHRKAYLFIHRIELRRARRGCHPHTLRCIAAAGRPGCHFCPRHLRVCLLCATGLGDRRDQRVSKSDGDGQRTRAGGFACSHRKTDQGGCCDSRAGHVPRCRIEPRADPWFAISRRLREEQVRRTYVHHAGTTDAVRVTCFFNLELYIPTLNVTQGKKT